MSLFSNLRLLVLARRIAIALESLASSQATLARLALEADERRSLEGFRPPPRKVELGVFDPKEASKRWRNDQIARGVSEEELDEYYGRLTDLDG